MATSTAEPLAAEPAASHGFATVAATATLRKKNQITLPELVVHRLALRPGDRLMMEVDERSGELRARKLLRSYAGLLDGVYGSPEEKAAYLAEERRSWGE